MIDFHTHILPELDDGSESIAQSISMLNILAADNVDAIVASPHVFLHKTSIEDFLQRRDNAYNALMSVIKDRNYPKIYKGAEVAVSTELIDCDDIERLCIEGTNCLLLEMPYTFWSDWIYRTIEMLVSERRLCVLIAHIDRYISRSNRIGIERLFSMHVSMQMNASYACSRLTRRSALRLIKDDKIAVLGSDCHNDDNRPPILGKAFGIINKSLGADTVYKIESNERKIFA